VLGFQDLECSSSKSNNAEYTEVDPPELPMEAVTEDNYNRQEENRNVDAYLCDSNAFFKRQHDASVIKLWMSKGILVAQCREG